MSTRPDPTLATYRSPGPLAKLPPRAPWYRIAWAWCRGTFARAEQRRKRNAATMHAPHCALRWPAYRGLPATLCCCSLDIKIAAIEARLGVPDVPLTPPPARYSE